ncbi:MAG: AAA family ATPase [Clostridia bacterium]|nr:AAA family ATPase [Clostridia bacterium]
MNENNTIELEVQLNRVIFKKDSFQILSLEVVNDKLKGHIITAKGTAPTLEYGMKYKLIAKTINDPKYGQQYQIISLSSNYDLKDGNEQKKFLSFFLTGNQLNNLFSIYPDPLPLLENKDIPGLCKVKGITPQKACKIIEAYEANKDNSVAYIKLHDYGLTKVAIDKLVETYGTPEVVVEKVTSNPYILIEEVKGYGWSKADAIALNSGTPPTSKFRLSAFAKYYLDKCANDNGHTWIDLQELRNAYFDVIPEATDEHIRETLKILTSPLFDKPSELIFHPENNKICLRKYKVLEENIARELKRLKKGANLSYESESFAQIKEDIENMQGWTFTEEQLEATQMILNNPVSIVTGSAGTGKTSSLQLATAVLKKSHCYGIAQTALSGRAASRMSEVTGLPGSTIHRLLGINPETGIAEIKSLSEQVIILDETSMVDGYIFLKLIKAIPTGHKFVMLGDINQLESIGLCNLLKDMIHSNTIPYRELKTIHRQAAKSGIITTATKVRNGEQIIPSIIWEGETVIGEMQDLKMIGLEGNLYTQEVILDNYKKLLNQKISKDDIDVIVPMRKRGNICLNTLNKKIQDIVANKSFNYITVSGKTKDESEQKIIYEQDRIIVTENCYKGVYDEKGNEVAIFNGNIGKVVSISEDGDTIEVDLTQQGRVTIPACLYRSLDLGYAITCHAKQGSETPYAIIGLDSSCYALMSKEWLYTAITRAKKYCILVGQNSMLHKAVQVSSVSKKQTWLQEMLNDNAV